MRTRVISAVVLLSVFGAAGASADQSAGSGEGTDSANAVPTVIVLNGGYRHELAGAEASGTSPSTADSTPTARATRVAARPVFWATFPRVHINPDGSKCLESVLVFYPDAESRDEAVGLQDHIWLDAQRDFSMCQPAGPRPDPTPGSLATEYWRVAGEDLLPRPAPHIAPGWMLAGKLAYLEANTQTGAHFEHPTPLGTLVIDATSDLYVDWGDQGGTTGPYAGPGRPWPDGTITHFWISAATYDVRVEQHWSATWHLAAASGQLAGLVTEGTLGHFEVRQLQAVRTN